MACLTQVSWKNSWVLRIFMNALPICCMTLNKLNTCHNPRQVHGHSLSLTLPSHHLCLSVFAHCIYQYPYMRIL